MKNFIKMLLLAVMFTAFSTALPAQSNRQRLTREQLAQAQARSISRSLGLDKATSTRFIDTYCQAQREIWALGPRPKRGRRGTINEETEQDIKQRFAHSQKILDIREKYYYVYSEFLTQQQIQRVYELEKQMINRLRRSASRRH